MALKIVGSSPIIHPTKIRHPCRGALFLWNGYRTRKDVKKTVQWSVFSPWERPWFSYYFSIKWLIPFYPALIAQAATGCEKCMNYVFRGDAADRLLFIRVGKGGSGMYPHISLFFHFFNHILCFDIFFAHNVLCCGQAGGAQTNNRCRCVVFCAPTALLQNFRRQLPRRRVRR